MIDLQTKLHKLISSFIEDKIDDNERNELFGIITDKDNEAHVKDVLLQLVYQLDRSAENKESMSSQKANEIFERIIQYKRTTPNVVSMKFTYKWWLWAAASIIVLCMTAAYWIFWKHNVPPDATMQEVAQNDISAPSSTNAMITLADGKTISLNEMQAGTIVHQDGLEIIKLNDGQIQYKVKPGQGIQYNTLTVPKGSKVVNIVLSDGTMVWINADSKIKYPIAFTGVERNVEIDGEAYFEVAHNEKQPFVVQKNETRITVLGTRFNVNAYNDFSETDVTLLQGQVKVSKGISTALLKPGQQAKVTSGITVDNHADVEKIMAWKNGYFQFNATPLQEMMQQISRWYDVDVSYRGKIPERKFGGKISRNTNISEVLKILKSSKIKFKIDGKKIVIMN